MADVDGELITELPPGFVSEFADEILGTIPQEKVQCELRQAAIARVERSVGSLSIPGIGQRVASIDPRLYFRMFFEAGKDPNFIHSYLADNPQLCSPGYRPKADPTRHGITFVNGEAIGKGPQITA